MADIRTYQMRPGDTAAARAKGTRNALMEAQAMNLPTEQRQRNAMNEQRLQRGQQQSELQALQYINQTARYVVDQPSYDAWKFDSEEKGLVAAGELPDAFDPETMSQIIGASQKQIETWGEPFKMGQSTMQRSSRGKVREITHDRKYSSKSGKDSRTTMEKRIDEIMANNPDISRSEAKSEAIREKRATKGKSKPEQIASDYQRQLASARKAFYVSSEEEAREIAENAMVDLHGPDWREATPGEQEGLPFKNKGEAMRFFRNKYPGRSNTELERAIRRKYPGL